MEIKKEILKYEMLIRDFSHGRLMKLLDYTQLLIDNGNTFDNYYLEINKQIIMMAINYHHDLVLLPILSGGIYYKRFSLN